MVLSALKCVLAHSNYWGKIKAEKALPYAHVCQSMPCHAMPSLNRVMYGFYNELYTVAVCSVDVYWRQRQKYCVRYYGPFENYEKRHTNKTLSLSHSVHVLVCLCVLLLLHAGSLCFFTTTPPSTLAAWTEQEEKKSSFISLKNVFALCFCSIVFECVCGVFFSL